MTIATVAHEIRSTGGPKTVQAEQLTSGLFLFQTPVDVDRDAPCRWRIGHHSGRLLAAFRDRDAALTAAHAIADWTDWTLDHDVLRAQYLGEGRDQAALDDFLRRIEKAGGHLDNCAAYGPYGC
jgi:autotransporter translocation and assembly factor TamB